MFQDNIRLINMKYIMVMSWLYHNLIKINSWIRIIEYLSFKINKKKLFKKLGNIMLIIIKVNKIFILNLKLIVLNYKRIISINI